MPKKSLRRRRRSRRRSSKKKTTNRRPKSKKMRGGVTTRSGVRRGNYRFLSTFKAQDLTRLPKDVFGEILEMHPLLTPKFNNITLRRAVRDYTNIRAKHFLVSKYGYISQWDVSNVTDMSWMFGGAVAFNESLNKWNVSKR